MDHSHALSNFYVFYDLTQQHTGRALKCRIGNVGDRDGAKVELEVAGLQITDGHQQRNAAKSSLLSENKLLIGRYNKHRCKNL